MENLTINNYNKKLEFINSNKEKFISKSLESENSFLRFYVNEQYSNIVGDIETIKGTFKNVDVDLTQINGIDKEKFLIVPFYYEILWVGDKTKQRIKDFYFISKEVIN